MSQMTNKPQSQSTSWVLLVIYVSHAKISMFQPLNTVKNDKKAYPDSIVVPLLINHWIFLSLAIFLFIENISYLSINSWRDVFHRLWKSLAHYLKK